jgi:hypothetical protein
MARTPPKAPRKPARPAAARPSPKTPAAKTPPARRRAAPPAAKTPAPPPAARRLPARPAAPMKERAQRRLLLAREGAALGRVVGPGRMATPARRVRFAGIVRRALAGLSPCLKRVAGGGGGRMALVRAAGGGAPALVLGRSLGAGLYGEAFLSTGARGAGRLLRVAAKVTPTSQGEEVRALQQMSRLAEAGLCPNMPVTFGALRCERHCREQGCPEVARDRAYYTVLSELAAGDLGALFAARLTRPQYESVLMQCLLALRAFHGLGLQHDDAHLGNFLFHRVPAGGYWRYDVPGRPPSPAARRPTLGGRRGASEASPEGGSPPTALFVPNRGILAVLWDPGMARPLRGPGAEWGSLEGAGDYFRVVNSFANLDRIDGARGRKLKAPEPADAAKMGLREMAAALHAAVAAKPPGAWRGAGGEPFGHHLFGLIVRGVREGRWLTSVRVGARRRLPVRDLMRGRGEAGKVRTPGGRHTLQRTRTLAPSPLPPGFRVLNARAFRLEPRRAPAASPPRAAASPPRAAAAAASPPPAAAAAASPPPAAAAAASPPPAHITRRRRRPDPSRGSLSDTERSFRSSGSGKP